MKLHPYRVRAFLYLGTILALIIILFATGLGANRFDLESRNYNLLSQISASALLLLFVYTIPFIVYAIKYWRLEIKPITPSPDDTQPHSFTVRFTTKMSIISDLREKIGTFSWNNSAKSIKLTSNSEGSAEEQRTVFEAPYNTIEKFTAGLNTITVKVRGQSYFCTSYDPSIDDKVTRALPLSKRRTPLMIIGTVRLQQAGVPELVEHLKLEGVKTVYHNAKRSVELGFIWSFALLFLGATALTVLLAK